MATTKKPRKQFEKAGQKKDTPGDMEGAFIFYDSLYRENPNSEMAEIWLMEHGCFDEDKQLVLAEKYGKINSPKKSPSKRNPRKKKEINEDDYDEEEEDDYKPKRKKKKTENKKKKSKKKKKDKKAKSKTKTKTKSKPKNKKKVTTKKKKKK